MPRRASEIAMLTAALLTVLLASATSAAYDAEAFPECDPRVLRPFSAEVSGWECVRDAGFRSTFDLLRVPIADAELLAICKSRACDTLFNERLKSLEREDECIVPMGQRIRLHADLLIPVWMRCTGIKDAYVLMDCDVVGTNGGERSEFWYFADSSNITTTPDDAHRYVIEGSTKAAWEGDEVAVNELGWEIFAYVDDTGASEPEGHHAGILEAGRGGLNSAYECSRADDWTYPLAGVSRCQRRYICYSE